MAAAVDHELAPDLAIARDDQQRQLGFREETEKHELLVEVVADVPGGEQHLRPLVPHLADEAP